MGCILVSEDDIEKERSELVVLGSDRQLKRQMVVSLVCPWAWQAAEEADACVFGLSLGWTLGVTECCCGMLSRL